MLYEFLQSRYQPNDPIQDKGTVLLTQATHHNHVLNSLSPGHTLR